MLIIANSSNLSSPVKTKKFGLATVRPTVKKLLLACAANCLAGTILAIT